MYRVGVLDRGVGQGELAPEAVDLVDEVECDPELDVAVVGVAVVVVVVVGVCHVWTERVWEW